MRKLKVDFHISDSFIVTGLRKGGVWCAYARPHTWWWEEERRRSISQASQ